MATHSTAGNGHIVSSFLARTRLGTRQFHKSLSVWPLLLHEGEDPDARPGYITLTEAMEAGSLRVDEVGEDGSVSQVRVINQGECPVLFLFGEEIRGAKQNRVANATFLVPAKTKLVVG